MNDKLNNYYLEKEEPYQGCLLAMRDYILKQDELITTMLKWGLPSFSYKNKIICLISFDKKRKEPYFLFWEGLKLENPLLDLGDRTFMKKYWVSAEKDLPINILNEIFKEALALYKDGIVKTKS